MACEMKTIPGTPFPKCEGDCPTLYFGSTECQGTCSLVWMKSKGTWKEYCICIYACAKTVASNPCRCSGANCRSCRGECPELQDADGNIYEGRCRRMAVATPTGFKIGCHCVYSMKRSRKVSRIRKLVSKRTNARKATREKKLVSKRTSVRKSSLKRR